MSYSLGSFPVGTASPAFLRGALPGVCSDAFPRIRRYLNANRVADVWTVTVSGVANSTVYTISINGISLSYTSDGSAANTEIVAGLVDAVNDSVLSGMVLAASTGATTLTLTSLQPGEALDVTENDSNLTLAHTTTASNATALSAGLIVSRTADGLGCAVPAVTAAVAQISTLTYGTAVNSVRYSATVTMRGGTYSGLPYLGEFTADGSATMQEIVEGIAADLNGKLPASTVAVTEDNSVLTFTSEVAGVAFAVDGNCADPAVTVTIATTTANVVGVFTYPLVGAVQYPAMKASGQVLADEVANIIAVAEEMFLTAENAPSALTDTVYIRGTAGPLASQVAGRIRFGDSDSGKCLAVTGLKLNNLSVASGSGCYSFQVDRPAGP